LWDARTGAQIGAVMQHADDVHGVIFSPDGARLLTVAGTDNDALPDAPAGAPTGEARLWNATTGAPLGRAMTHARVVTQATFSRDGTRIATASVDKTARVWDGHTGAPLLLLQHKEKVTRISFNADGSRILTASFGELDASGAAHLWSATGKPIAEMRQGNPTSARFSPDGGRIATIGFGPSEAYLFDGTTGKPISYVTHKRGDMVWGFMFSSDGTLLATSGGGEVRLWDARTGASIGSPLTGETQPNAVVFSTDDPGLMTMNGSDLYRWDVAAWSRTGAPLIAQACEVLTSTRAGRLPPELSDRAFRGPQASRPCEQRGLLDWRFYTGALFGDR
jgi:dipeptidyl aminopeptidase/acylaminoacyl peptidase